MPDAVSTPPGLVSMTAELVERALVRRAGDAVSSPPGEAGAGQWLERFDFQVGRDAAAVAAELLEALRSCGVRSDHPRYFGLFNPPALEPAIAGDLIAAAINPQLAAWSHAPVAAEIESRLVSYFGDLVWGSREGRAGCFTSGGSEANHTALLAALATRYPDWGRHGVRACPRPPAIFTSDQSHLAWIKIARAAGLGDEAVVLVPARDGLSLRGEEMHQAIGARPDLDPVLLVGTAGATAHGAIDDLAGIARVAALSGSHFHVDAAWAGALLIDGDRRGLFEGIDNADSVTIDPHKWLAVPMGAGLYLARDWRPQEAAFAVSTTYMPARAARDPYVHSLQWSRRFNGAKLFMALATLGVEGYRAQFARQFAAGDRLRRSLVASGWVVQNETPLPIICFAPPSGGDEAVLQIERDVVGSGQAWLSNVTVRSRLALRACVTSFETGPADVDLLVGLLNAARRRIGASRPDQSGDPNAPAPASAS